MQKATVIGNIVRDAKVNEVNGRRAINFVVAVNKSYKNKEGVKVDSATFWNCTHWKESTQSVEVAKYLTKGIKVYVEGEPSAELYKKKDNSTGVDMRINVGHLTLLTFADKPEANTGEPAGVATSTAEQGGDDLPF